MRAFMFYNYEKYVCFSKRVITHLGFPNVFYLVKDKINIWFNG
jgi:hypothetical protein